MNTALAPLPWKLKISSLGPQSILSLQLQFAGPPYGVALLLIARIIPVNPGVTTPKGPPASGSPETPIALAGSAQRQYALFRSAGVPFGSPKIAEFGPDILSVR